MVRAVATWWRDRRGPDAHVESRPPRTVDEHRDGPPGPESPDVPGIADAQRPVPPSTTPASTASTASTRHGVGSLPPTDGPNEPIWAAGSQVPEPDLPPLQDEVRADLCVIGLGGSGLAAVAEALERGLTVVGLDAGPVAGRASGRNGGFLLAGMARFHHDAVRHFGRDRAVAWYRATLEELDHIAATNPDVRRVGSVRLAVDDTEFADIQRQVAAMRADGLPVEEWEEGDERGLLVPTDAAANPLARCRRLADAVTTAGANLFAHSPARTLSGRRVTTAGGVIDCDRVVVAVDGALGTVLPEVAGRVRSVRLQMLGTAPTAEVALPRPVYARYGLDYWSQGDDGRIALGGGRDHGADEEDGAQPVPSTPVQEYLDDLLRDRLGVQAEVTHRWAATVGFTASGLPVCEQVRPGVWAVGGYSGTGNVVGSMLARVAVELAHRGSSDRADALFAA